MSQPLISVRITTYNHGKYIAQTLDSVLMQKGDFELEIVVGDDFSTDDTPEILAAYEQKYPKQVRFLKREKGDAYHQERLEKGRLFNFINTLSHCRGSFIALLDGDDYWLDEYKLQKQMQAMEAHSDWSACFHDILLVDDKGEALGKEKLPKQMFKVLSHEEMVAGYFPCPPTASQFFKKSCLPEIPDWFYQMHGDLALSILLSENGKTGYVEGKLSAYRWHDTGLWTTRSRASQFQKSIFMRKVLIEKYRPVGYAHNCKLVVNNYLGWIRATFPAIIKPTWGFVRFLLKYPIGWKWLFFRLSGKQ